MQANAKDGVKGGDLPRVCSEVVREREIGAPLIQVYDTEAHSSAQQNWAAMQDAQGVMYFGNGAGVLIFDGQRWQLVETSNKSVVRSLARDERGVIYVGGNGEVGFLAADSTGQARYVSLMEHVPQEDRDFGDVWSCHATSQGVYFVVDDKVMLWHDGSVRVLQSPGSNRGYLLDGRLFLARTDKGIFEVKDELTPCLLPGTERLTGAVHGRAIVASYAPDTLLVATSQKGLFLYDQRARVRAAARPGISDDDSPLRPFPTDFDAFLTTNRVYRVTPLPDGTFAIATTGGGIAIMNRRGHLLRTINRNDGLTSDGILALYVDRAQNLWACLNKGIAHIEINCPWSWYGPSRGLDESVLQFCRHRDRIYVGLFNGVRYLPDSTVAPGRPKTFQPVANTNTNCLALHSAGKILLAGQSGRVIAIRGDSAEVVANIDGTPLSFGTSPRFPGVVFVGLTNGLGIVRLPEPADPAGKPQYDRPAAYTELGDAYPGIASDGIGDLWLTTYVSGIWHVHFRSSDPLDVEVTHYTKEDGLPDDSSVGVSVLDGRVLVVHEKGLLEAVRQPEGTPGKPFRFVPEATFGKLLNDEQEPVYDVQRDSLGCVWVDTKKGIGIVRLETDGSYRLDRRPGRELPGNAHGLFPDQGGVVWISTSKGFFRYDPVETKTYGQDFTTLISLVKTPTGPALFNGFLYAVESGRNGVFPVRSSKQPALLTPRLPYARNSLTFAFSGAWFERPDSTRFRYLLRGYDRDWSDWTLESKKEYTNLPEGSYTFHVVARNSAEQAGDEATFSFQIAPPWYRTALAYAGYLLLLLGLLSAASRIQSRRLIAAKVRLERIVAERTEEITLQKEAIERKAAELLIAKHVAEEQREAAAAANHAKSEFLACMSHEIRTPMNSIIGFSEMLMDHSLTDEQRDFVRTISRSGEALLAIINDVLDLSKIEAGELSFDPADFDPELLAFEVCELLGPRVGAKPIELLCRIGDSVPAFVHSDPTRFRQVLVNLLGNAIKFTEEGEIELALTVEDEEESRVMLHVAVRDTGIGLAPEKRELIFLPFRQADGSTTRRYGGTGLGLAICRQIAGRMNGRTWVESQEGVGSTFHFLGSMGKSNKQTHLGRTRETLDGRRVLFVDDNDQSREILAHVLRREGMDVVTLARSTEAIGELERASKQQRPFELAILDLHMPELSGDDLARAIRRLPRELDRTPLLALSSATVRRTELHKVSGFDAHLIKPASRGRLLQVIERLLCSNAPESADLITPQSILEEAKHSVRILLVEDNVVNQKLATFMLGKAGYQVTVAGNGVEAVRIFSEAPDHFDLIFMDIQMPVMDGREATAALRGKGFREIPIIAMTAETMQGDRERCLAAGMDDYISKPIKRDLVFRMVKKYALADKREAA
jgi:signal transduction histidine kinase/DNA-binding response OmpR family regulator/ligand-binding sensor domain-containing protein